LIKQKTAIIVGIYNRNRDGNIREAEAALEEMVLLARTSRLIVSEAFVKTLESFNHATLFGEGQVRQIDDLVKKYQANIVIVDHKMSPAQIRNLEKNWECTVIDRTDLILEIFQQHAGTREAELQIEMARLQYLLPRLTGQWTHLDRQYGGIGIRRGVGETQLEKDRRLVKQEIAHIRSLLKKVEQSRETQQNRRRNSFRIALVGYTNAGKSTLLNTLTGSKTYADDKLFATLDPRTRRWILPGNIPVLITDTIGFIRRLPHHLIASFKSALIEAHYADLIWHVVDYSHPEQTTQEQIVLETLKEIGLQDKPIWTLNNKIDRCSIQPGMEKDGVFYISALNKNGFQALIDAVFFAIAKNNTNSNINQ